MPGSTTTRGQLVSCDIDTSRRCLLWDGKHQHPNLSYAAQYLACALPCAKERFDVCPRGQPVHHSGPVRFRYSFTVTDFHRLPLAGLPAHTVHTRHFAGMSAFFALRGLASILGLIHDDAPRHQVILPRIARRVKS